jgi:hypothetical protein
MWSGTGITNIALGTFNPAVAGGGNHLITYTTHKVHVLIWEIYNPRRCFS